jgi:hypothetical protein
MHDPNRVPVLAAVASLFGIRARQRSDVVLANRFSRVVADAGAVGGLVILLSAASVAFAAAPEVKSFEWLGTFGGLSAAGDAINDFGDVAGSAVVFDGSFRYQVAAAYVNNHASFIAGISFLSDARDINDKQEVVGYANIFNAGYRWTEGSGLQLVTLQGTFRTNLSSINNHGVAAGGRFDSVSAPAGIAIRNPGGDIASTEGANSSSINDLGHVAGVLSPGGDGDQPSELFVDRNGAFTNFGTHNGLYTHVGGMNEDDKVVGYISDDHITDLNFQPFMHDGAFNLLPLLPGNNNGIAQGINDGGLIVGENGSGADTGSAVVWKGGQVFDLNTVAGSMLQGGHLIYAAGVSDHGWITGTGMHNGVQEAWRMELVCGEEINWQGNSSLGSFHDTARWDRGVVPSSCDIVIFDTDGTNNTVNFSGNPVVEALRIRNDDLHLDMGGHTMSVLGIDTTAVIVGERHGDTAFLTITNGTLDVHGDMITADDPVTVGVVNVGADGRLNVGGDLQIGERGLNGVLRLSDNAQVRVDGSIKMAGDPGTTAALTASGDVLELISGPLVVGEFGTATLNISNTTSHTSLVNFITSRSITLGDQLDSHGTLVANGNGVVVEAGIEGGGQFGEGRLVIGVLGTGEATVSQGAALVAGETVVGLANVGSLTVKDSDSTLDTATLSVGSVGTGTFTLSGGAIATVKLSASVGDAGVGTATVSGSSSWAPDWSWEPMAALERSPSTVARR